MSNNDKEIIKETKSYFLPTSKGMKVSIEVDGKTIWYRDEEKLEGMMSTGYIKDGTQEKIIAALENALFQAKGQMQLADNVD
ncbi:Rrf2 family transcriptional regulator [Providencia rettgeri]